MTRQNQNNHGGSRPGAGRPRKPIAKRYAFNAPDDIAQILEALPGSKSDYIISAIRAYKNNHDN